MRKPIGMLGVLGLWLLSACAILPEKTLTSDAIGFATRMNSLSELPTQQLAKGQCALVLWSHGSPPGRILLALDRPAVARVQIDGKQLELTRVSQSGQPLYGQFPEQRYQGGGLSIGVSFAPDTARDLTGGAVVSSAVVEYIDAEGWTAIIPASGLIGCQT